MNYTGETGTVTLHLLVTPSPHRDVRLVLLRWSPGKIHAACAMRALRRLSRVRTCSPHCLAWLRAGRITSCLRVAVGVSDACGHADGHARPVAHRAFTTEPAPVIAPSPSVTGAIEHCVAADEDVLLQSLYDISCHQVRSYR